MESINFVLVVGPELLFALREEKLQPPLKAGISLKIFFLLDKHSSVYFYQSKKKSPNSMIQPKEPKARVNAREFQSPDSIHIDYLPDGLEQHVGF